MAITKKELQQDKILDALAVAKDITEASEISGVSRKTIYKYLNDFDFILAYRDQKRAQLRELSCKMSNGATKAIDCLVGIIDDSSTPPQTKASASFKILELFSLFRSLEGEINDNIFNESPVGVFGNHNKL